MRFNRPSHIKSRAIDTFAEDFILVSVSAGIRSNEGEFTPGDETRTIESGSIEPASNREDAMNLVPEGLKVSDLKWIFVNTNLKIKALSVDDTTEGSSGDYVIWPVSNGERYKVISVASWGADHNQVLIARVTAAPGVAA